ncbi:glycoside hydrolase [Pterulicium gracile]|uniref:Glycoside hydrolase n=1 Tax=Pterulicium gracile TaxID=1884261 RepID=A0A5C3R0Z5_9AGAR|nr:glycoside hydrolase [Pterula gracilis]
MISTQANRSKLIASCNAFIAKYSLDGIDIDMEYPDAMERNGPATDTPSLTAFFKEAKAGLGGKNVSVAAPAGYWFLKGFEIDKVVDHVDYINMMSYDLHGAWDKDVADEDGTAKPHTSSEDIMDSISLYTRAKVDLSKVNLGMAWYGRTIKSQTEIWDEIEANNITPTYDSQSNTYWYNHGNDFVSYDDEESWAYKHEMAGKYCFGGTFVWSLDLGKKHE